MYFPLKMGDIPAKAMLLCQRVNVVCDKKTLSLWHFRVLENTTAGWSQCAGAVFLYHSHCHQCGRRAGDLRVGKGGESYGLHPRWVDTWRRKFDEAFMPWPRGSKSLLDKIPRWRFILPTGADCFHETWGTRESASICFPMWVGVRLSTDPEDSFEICICSGTRRDKERKLLVCPGWQGRKVFLACLQGFNCKMESSFGMYALEIEQKYQICILFASRKNSELLTLKFWWK